VSAASLLVLRDDEGCPLPLEPSRWHRPSAPVERELLGQIDGPVLDVGCGPGRVLDALGRQGVVALGVDPAPGAAALARSRGVAVLQRSVFDRLPGERRWGTVLLLDGNIGIGGDPVRLLRRCADLVRPRGQVLVEVKPPGTGWRRCRARLERGPEVGSWFAWAVVGADAVGPLASTADLGVASLARSDDGRWFASLEKSVPEHACA